MSNRYEKELCNLYGDVITCRATKSEDTRIEYRLTDKLLSTLDFVVYINEPREIAVIWNVAFQRIHGSTSHTFSIDKKWHELLEDNSDVYAYYKKFRTKYGLKYEKVVATTLDNLFMLDLYELMEFAKDDEDFPEELKNDKTIRERGLVERLKRDHNFRKKVLHSYNYQCAVCRCSEEKLLEAAHIIAVKDGGSDNTENGVCLCANHHLMFDSDLIKIDFKNFSLSYVDKSVKTMAWYSEFNNKYGGKILKQQL